MTFNVGDSVRMSEKGKTRYSHSNVNPHNLDGIIESFAMNGSYIYVIWPNEVINTYRESEIEYATKYELKDFI